MKMSSEEIDDYIRKTKKPISIGDWAMHISKDIVYYGYVVNFNENYVFLNVTYPFKRDNVMFPEKYTFTKYSSEDPHPDDLPALIDLSLDIKDEEWFIYLTSVYNSWIPIEKFMENRNKIIID